MAGSRGDVLGVVEERSVTGGSYECAEIVRYSAGGVPRVIGHFGADMNESGGVPDEADIGAFFLLYGAGDPRADFNGSGGVPDDADVVLFFQVWDAGIGQGTADDNRFGWRGYMWDARLGLYHVRHRVYDPWSMSWLQRDPAWFKDGLNRYAYCRGDLENGYDPYGLWFENTATHWVNSGNAAARMAGHALGWVGGYGEEVIDRFGGVIRNMPGAAWTLGKEAAFTVQDVFVTQWSILLYPILGEWYLNEYQYRSALFNAAAGGGTWGEAIGSGMHTAADLVTLGLLSQAEAYVQYLNGEITAEELDQRTAGVLTGVLAAYIVETAGRAVQAQRGGAAAGEARAPAPTGQQHHWISKRVHQALEDHPNLAGRYAERDPRFVTRAKNPESHRGYQKWHRDLDAEVARWIRRNRGATPEQFEQYLRNRYGQPDLLDRFPDQGCGN